MNLIILGPQGSGKGTQAKLIVDKFGLVHLEMGGLLRRIAQENSPLGQKIASLINNGILVPDDIISELIGKALDDKLLGKGFIIDGYPRTLTQAQWFDKYLATKQTKIDKLLYINISRQEALRRLSARKNCPKCGRVYNLLTMPPKNGQLCDDCQVELVSRADEAPEAINKRLDIFYSQTRPIVDYYRRKGKVVQIDGQRPVEEIFTEISQKLTLEGQLV